MWIVCAANESRAGERHIVRALCYLAGAAGNGAAPRCSKGDGDEYGLVPVLIGNSGAAFLRHIINDAGDVVEGIAVLGLAI